MRLLRTLTLAPLFPVVLAEPIPPIPAQTSPPGLSDQQYLFPSAQALQSPRPNGVSTPFFASLERAARLVDIAYCVGTTGISPPFSCVSRCKDFPSLRLIRTWNTGVLLSDSCGYIAVDHGSGHGHDGGTSRSRAEGTGGENGNKPEIVVAFRGTYSLTNTIVDLSTVPQEYVPYPVPPPDNDDKDGDGRCDNCTVHTGFMASWRNARETVLPALHAARQTYPGYRVHLIGHSLGGAVAALAALELRLGLGWRDVLVTTFGEPRVGNAKLAEYLDRAFGLLRNGREEQGMRYRRVTHVDDPVPLLPLREWGYRAHAGEVYIGKAELPPAPEDLRLCKGDEDPECIARAETEDWFGWLTAWMKRARSQQEERAEMLELQQRWLPARLKLWQLFFAHRDYFWRLGLCVPGGDPADWGREKDNMTLDHEVNGAPEVVDL
ncbi:alpha/beta-hydrolase [Parathielavia appendiculata]|uniref:Alpha/beta-hydrolase n=1 Tax=Parathielavia appendiculata TaxID=2587402 RepID=A0AAN6UBN2_9PEZI|nr:alpha/beta-hydrolase [Parathielavia appendiculata]